MFRIQLARLGQTMEQGTLVRWLKREGESVEIGEELYEVETEKAIVPVQATKAGRILRHVTREGDTVKVGAVLAVAAEAGEDASQAQIDVLARSDGSEDVQGDDVRAAASAPPSAPAAPAGKLNAMPKARTLASELGIDLRNVKGTGPEGVIVPDDVRRAASATKSSAAPAQTDSGADVKLTRKAPLTPIGRSMMNAVEKGWQIPQFTQVSLVDATALERNKAASTTGLTFMDFFLDALVVAARNVPDVLVSLHGQEVWYHAQIDITIATATEHGLLVPVLRDAGAMEVGARAKAWRALSEKAREGKLTPGELSGGIVALSNLGTRGVDHGMPLLPPGHSLIVFVGGLKPRALVVGDRVEARPSVYLSVAYDHRLIDGALAAQFTSALRTALEGANYSNG